MILQGDLTKLKTSGTCEICTHLANDLYLKHVYAGHKECLALDIDLDKVSRNILEINKSFAPPSF